MSHTIAPERIKRALENVDANVQMFSGYQPTPHVIGTLEQLRADRAELEQLAAGDRTYDALSSTNKDRFFDMPAWGTYGT